jgi:putative transposase
MLRRPKRLAGVRYVGSQRYFLTFCTAKRHRAFEKTEIANGCLWQLRRRAAVYDIALVAYCFMPDHVHLVVYGASERADLREFVVSFKQVTGFEYRQRHGRSLWQPGYFDRVLRDDEATKTVARYTLENPIRAGLATRLGEYPFAGSDLYDLQGLLTAWEDGRRSRRQG